MVTFLLSMWIYRAILQPLDELQKATREIKNGNLDYELDVTETDEIGQLCQDFEEMRQRLKDQAEEKIQYDMENKELISNISHD
ncbi:MAG: HAMP domain-containing protein, partial [Muribaculaceae bacterium]|nr:HAMP domain-containing protein [Muribaculaceae bacterium]